MVKVTKVVGIAGLIICLLLMYTTDHGIPGIKKFDSAFTLLDMRFHYNSEAVQQCFEQIGAGGRTAYLSILILDFVFIACLLITMLTITKAAVTLPRIRTTLYIVCVLRAILDILENCFLLSMLNRYPVFSTSAANLCSWFTTFKFIMLCLWLLVLVARGLSTLVQKSTSPKIIGLRNKFL